MRGNLHEALDLRTAKGSIPACAGEPHSAKSMSRLPWVYPRVCGGTPSRILSSVSANGLSPRMRGNQPSFRLTELLMGSIPACAGEPFKLDSCSKVLTVYPRVCGGTEKRMNLVLGWSGLSPRVRGNRT